MLSAREDLVSDESVVASELTRFELLAGARPDEHDPLENFFSVVDWIPESYSQALEIGLEEGKGDDAPDDAGQFVEWSPVAAG